jgi:hypothetical protein
MLEGLLVFTLILFEALIVIQDGHNDPLLSLQLEVGKMPQLLESVN